MAIIVPVNSVGSLGIISDRRPHEIPLNAWSAGRNVAFRDDYAEKFLGDSLYATPPVAPYFVLPVSTTTGPLWLVAGLGKVYYYDGANFTDITRTTGGDYGALAQFNWTGGVLNGVPVINNGIDDPQMWSPPTPTTRLTALSAWPANTKCLVLRPFKNFLVAGDIVKSSTRYPQMVMWSHPADAGSVPASWDVTDPTKDAGEYSLAETGGAVVDFVTLRDLNIVYKEDAIYKMQYIGGLYIFKFSELTKTLGVLSRRCAVEFQTGHHLVLGRGDIVRHDGQQVVSVLDGRMKKFFYENLDPTYYERSFVFANQGTSEVWCCFPASGNVQPSLAIVWSWKNGTCTVKELPEYSHVVSGVVEPSSSAWDDDTDVWDSDESTWDSTSANPVLKTSIAAVPSATQLRLVEDTNTFSGSAMTAYVERTGIGVPLKTGAPPDFTTMKLCTTIWPRIEGTDGGVVEVTVGTQDDIDGSVTWSSPQAYVIGTTRKIDTLVSGRLLAVRFASYSNIEWRLHGYEMEITPDGGF